MRQSSPYLLRRTATAFTVTMSSTTSRPPFRGAARSRAVRRSFSNRPPPFSADSNLHSNYYGAINNNLSNYNHSRNFNSMSNDGGNTSSRSSGDNNFRGRSPTLPFNRQRHNQPSGATVHRPKPPDFRSWEFSKLPPPPHSERFVVLSYNILADYLANSHRKLYFHIPRRFMSWEWRKGNILFELRLWSPDIMCFQEVDKYHELEEDLRVRGYSGIWKMRTGDPMDGCAIFWRTTRFRLIYEECIEFNKHGMRDNVAQICVLESLAPNQNGNQLASSASSEGPNRVVICNTHVLYNPRRGEIKLGQVRILLERAQAVSKTWDDAPVVLCGDFNCTPMSALYNFISEQKLNISEVDRDKVSGQASAQICPPPRQYGPQSSQGGLTEMTTDAVGNETPKRPVFTSTQDVVSSGSPSEEQETKEVPVSEQRSWPGNSGRLSSVIDASDKNIVEKETRDTHSSNMSLSDNSQSAEVNMLGSIREPSLSICVASDPNTSSALNHDIDEIASGLSVNEMDETSEYDEPLGENVEASSSDLKNGEGDLVPDYDTVDVDIPSYDPSLWTPMEIATATGNASITNLEHPLKLRSTYSEVVESSGTRDSNGEPLVTSYNTCFMGTVDYIWRSEGLCTLKVLAPIPKDAMQPSGGFPTKKWGSDHIALASELAFTKK